MNYWRLTTIAILLTFVGRMQADNLSVENVTAQAGELKQIAIVLNNPTHQYIGFQFDLVLPDGFTLAQDDRNSFMASLNGDRVDDHTLSVADMGEHTYRFLSFSLNNSVYTSTEGVLVYATVQVSKDIAVGEYNATIKSQILTDANSEEVRWQNLSFKFIIEELSIVTARSYSRVYGDANPQFEYTVEGRALEGKPEIFCEATTTSPVGTYDIIISQGSVTNENVTYVKGTLTITKTPLTIKVGEYVRKQGEENPEFTPIYEGFKNNETEEILTKKPTITCLATKDSEPGDYEITVSGAEAQNYEITYVVGKLIVTRDDPVTLTAMNYTRIYGEENPLFEFSAEGAALNGTPEITCEATTTSPIGTYDIIISQGSVTNYNVTYVKGTLTITKAPLTIKAGEYTRKQGEENPEFTLTYEGFKNNETEAVLTKQPTATSSATKDSEPGEYEVTVSGAEAQNYSISYVNGKLTVEALPVIAGDANDDDTVNAADIVELVKFIMGNPSSYFNEKAADVNGDGVVNAADIVLIVNTIMNT